MPVQPTGGRPVPKRARSARLPVRAVAPLVVTAFLFLAVAAIGAFGAEHSAPQPIPDSAFGPVILPPGASAAVAGPGPLRTPDLTAIRDPWLVSAPASALPDRAQPSLPGTNAVIVPLATPKPAATPRTQTSSGATGSSSHSISGSASWYCRAGSSPCTSGYPDGGGFDAYAAAGPRLRAAIGSSWRGKIVSVDGIRVKLIDWCQCFQGQSNEKLLDLYYDVFARVGFSVTIRW